MKEGNGYPTGMQIGLKAGVANARKNVYRSLQRPRVRAAIAQALEEEGVTSSTVSRVIREAMGANVIYRGRESTAPDHYVRLRSAQVYGKWMGLEQEQHFHFHEDSDLHEDQVLALMNQAAVALGRLSAIPVECKQD